MDGNGTVLLILMLGALAAIFIGGNLLWKRLKRAKKAHEKPLPKFVKRYVNIWELEINRYYAYEEPPYGFMMIKYKGTKGQGLLKIYLFEVQELVSKNTTIEMSEKQVTSTVYHNTL